MQARDLVVLILLVSLPATAQTITDGDTLKQGGVTSRLWGIDTPEQRLRRWVAAGGLLPPGSRR